MFLVGGFIHEGFQFTFIGDSHLDEPTIIFGTSVDQGGFVSQSIVNFRYSSGDGGVDIRSSLDGFDTAKGFSLLEFILKLGKVNKDNVTQSSLGKVGDSDSPNTSFDGDVFVS